MLVALLLLLGAARDLWRATHPVTTPAPAGAGPVPGGAAAGGPAASPGPGAAALVDLNRAGPAELDALPGIGPVLAGRIIRHREAHGPFHEPEDLLAVPGIGPRLLERLRPRVRAGAGGSAPVRAPGADSAARGLAIGNPGPGERVQIPVQTAGGRGR